jgi:N-acetylglucosaminyldiphosphoundecaprenol N-acetyl-beta-D-mannosaminyltransferase
MGKTFSHSPLTLAKILKASSIRNVKSPTLLGVPISGLNQTEIETTLNAFLDSQTLNHIATVNPEFLVEADTNKDFKKLLNQTALNICDGIGIKLWTKILYKKNMTRITGVSLAEQLCAMANKRQQSVYFLGGFGVAREAARIMGVKHPTLLIAGWEDGDPDVFSEALAAAKPDILLVAFGAPAQEFWIQKYATKVPSIKMAVGVGGTFDFWACKAKRAPRLMQRMGLEWFWRLSTEPKRAHRIYKAVVVFSWLVLKEKLFKSR